MNLRKENTNASDFHLLKNTLSVGNNSNPEPNDLKESTAHYLFRNSDNQVVGGFSIGTIKSPDINLQFGKTLSFWNLFVSGDYNSSFDYFDALLKEVVDMGKESKFDSLFTEAPESECHKYKALGFVPRENSGEPCYVTKRLF
jgi:hypothetical protein